MSYFGLNFIVADYRSLTGIIAELRSLAATVTERHFLLLSFRLKWRERLHEVACLSCLSDLKYHWLVAFYIRTLPFLFFRSGIFCDDLLFTFHWRHIYSEPRCAQVLCLNNRCATGNGNYLKLEKLLQANAVVPKLFKSVHSKSLK